MSRFLLNRVLQLVPVALGVTIVVFLMVQIIPGDIVDAQLGSQASGAEKAALRESLGLNQNIVVQYFVYLSNVVRGDLGVSSTYHEPVTSILFARLGNTAILAIPAVIIAAVFGILLGTAAALRQNGPVDRVVTISVLFVTSMPSFWLGMLLVIVFGVGLQWVPTSGMESTLGGGSFSDIAWHAILPVMTLSAWSLAVIARMTRSSMIETLKSDYVRSVRGKGLPERLVVAKHALPNALPPVITVVGLQAGFLLSGAVLTETVFAWPGIGFAMSQAIENRDTVLLQGGILFIAIIFVLVNFFVDVLYAFLNPKLRRQLQRA
ncbi:ABC transporter permease [Rhodococcus sp. ABRD24]|nr:ABC transporter permease [Rhodococcus sp. ABRD24]